jgi:hypothetical protein
MFGANLTLDIDIDIDIDIDADADADADASRASGCRAHRFCDRIAGFTRSTPRHQNESGKGGSRDE